MLYYQFSPMINYYNYRDEIDSNRIKHYFPDKMFILLKYKTYIDRGFIGSILNLIAEELEFNHNYKHDEIEQIAIRYLTELLIVDESLIRRMSFCDGFTIVCYHDKYWNLSFFIYQNFKKNLFSSKFLSEYFIDSYLYLTVNGKSNLRVEIDKPDQEKLLLEIKLKNDECKEFDTMNMKNSIEFMRKIFERNDLVSNVMSLHHATF